jgi:P27 family predicted phage terminase small subunit
MPTPKKPTAIKKIQGTFRRDRAANEANPDPFIPQPPDFLDSVALAEWNRLAPELYDLGLLARIDRAALAGYCTAYSRWCASSEILKTEEQVITTSNGNFVQNPRLGIVRRALDDMRKWAIEFGMTPSSRSRVNVNKDKKRGKKPSPFDLLPGGKSGERR